MTTGTKTKKSGLSYFSPDEIFPAVENNLLYDPYAPDGDGIAASLCESLRDDYNLLNVKAREVLLTADDIREHNIPLDMEAKEKSANYDKFVAENGIYVPELDACPVDLIQSKLRDAIESCLNMDLFRAEEAKEKEDWAIVAATKEIVRKALSA